MKAAGRRISWWHMLAVLCSGVVPRAIWLKRLTVCAGCPVLDRARMVCWNEKLQAGCHCYVPAIALFKRQCWAKDAGLEGEGWGAWEKKS